MFVRAHKPADFLERNLESINLYSIVTHGHTHHVTDIDVYLRRFRHKVRRFLAHLRPTRMLNAIDQAVTGKERA